MAMIYSDFVDFITRTVWRTGDADFSGDVDTLVVMAEAMLARDLKTQRRIAKATISATSPDLTLPGDYYEAVSLSSVNGALQYISVHDADELLAATLPAPRPGNAGYYTVRQTIEVLQDIEAANPVDFDLTYYTTLPSYMIDGESWVQVNYFDIYTNCVLLQTAPYLREDPRLQIWSQLYVAGLESVLRDDTARRYAGSPLKMRLPGIIR